MLSVAPLPPTLVLTPVLLRFTLTPGRTLMVLRKRKYPMALAPLVDRSGRPPTGPDSSTPFDHYSQRFAMARSDAPRLCQRLRLKRLPNRLSLSLTWPTAVFLALSRSWADSRSRVCAYFCRLASSPTIRV